MSQRTMGSSLDISMDLHTGSRQVLLQPIAIVDALYVEEGYRGKGIAKDLFRKFQEFASGCGAASIELKVMSRNRDALRLYASLGFCETKKYMALPLSQMESKLTFFFNNNETGTGLTRKGHAGSCFRVFICTFMPDRRPCSPDSSCSNPACPPSRRERAYSAPAHRHQWW